MKATTTLLTLIFFALSMVVAVSFVQPAFAADADNGQNLYTKKCKGCHGPEGAGDGPMAKALKLEIPPFVGEDGKLIKSDDELKAIIVEGKGKMPTYGEKLKPEEIDDILAFINSLAP